MALGGELVARDVDRFDLRLRRQLSSFEAVDAQDGVGRHVHQLAPHFVGIVGERFDLLARERRAERALRVGGGRLTVASDGDLVLDRLDREDRDLFIVPGAQADVPHLPRLKSGKLRLDVIVAGRQRLERREPRIVRLDRADHRLRRIVCSRRGDHRAGNHRAGLVDHGQQQLRRPGLRVRARGSRTHEQRERAADDGATNHFLTSNLRGSIF